MWRDIAPDCPHEGYGRGLKYWQTKAGQRCRGCGKRVGEISAAERARRHAFRLAAYRQARIWASDEGTRDRVPVWMWPDHMWVGGKNTTGWEWPDGTEI